MATSRVVLMSIMLLMAYGNLKGAEAQAEVSCRLVMRYLLPCASYVASVRRLSPMCCSSIKTLYGEAATTAERQGVCDCIKTAIRGYSFSRYNLGLAAGLPGKCGIDLPFKISPSTDCKSVT